MSSVHAALNILEAVARKPRCRLVDLVEELGLPKTTIHRNLVALAEAGWIRQDKTGRDRVWTTTVKLLVLSRLADQIPDLRSRALPVMEELRDETGENTHLVVPEHYYCVLIERLDSPHHLHSVNPIGGRVLMHASATGKAILASFSDTEFEGYLRRPLEAVTSRTITDSRVLARELGKVRKRGYAINDREMNEHVRAVGAAILDVYRKPIAGLSISGPIERMKKEKLTVIGGAVAAAAQKISISLIDEKRMAQLTIEQSSTY